MTIDWRNAPWYASLNGRDELENRRHEAALANLEEHETNGKPFVLYLRKFGIRQLYGDENDPYGRAHPEGFTLDDNLHRWTQWRGVGFVKVHDLGISMDAAIDGTRIPALFLNDAWLDAVVAMISRAELIVSECQFLSAGVQAELQACIDLGRIDRTVLVLPSPPFDFIGNEPIVQRFARTIHIHELDPAPVASAVFTDLIERIGRIAKLEPTRRRSLIQNRELDAVAPVTFRGVATGLFKIARDYARTQNVGATYFAGSRAIMAAEAEFGLPGALVALMELADLSRQAGSIELAITMLDDTHRKIVAEGARLAKADAERFVIAERGRRMTWLSSIFELLSKEGKTEELWRWAVSQAGAALERRDFLVVAQCHSAMAVAMAQVGNYEQAKEHANDAIRFAQSANDRYQEGFATVYLGHAFYGLGQVQEAAAAYRNALAVLPKDKVGQIHALALSSMAAVAEELGQPAAALALYRSTLEVASGVGLRSVAEDAEAAITRLSAIPPHAGDSDQTG